MSSNHVKTGLQDSFKHQKLCDVTFSCSDPTASSGKSTIMAHKLILSMASDVFHTMFNGEAAKHIKNEEINIEDIKMPTFKLFLSFIYNNVVYIETIEAAVEFYYAAHKYNAIDALTFIKDYMLGKANTENAIYIYNFACLYDNKELKDACLKIVSEYTMDVLKSQFFLTADPKTIEDIYKLDVLNINSEVALVEALERYVSHNQADNSEILEKVRPALSHIRFLTVDVPIIAKTTLLNSDDALKVIGCMSSGAVSEMPTFLSQNKQKRALTTTTVQMIRKLAPVYTDKYCNWCNSNNAGSNHLYWSCTTVGTKERMQKIYQKYNHVWLFDYHLDDLKAVYEIYKSKGYVK